jgi:hypothetical protein
MRHGILVTQIESTDFESSSPKKAPPRHCQGRNIFQLLSNISDHLTAMIILLRPLVHWWTQDLVFQYFTSSDISKVKAILFK